MSRGRFWILTIPENDWSVPEALPDNVVFLLGQLEQGESGYKHWQFIAYFNQTVRLAQVKRVFCNTCHAEPTRGPAAEAYVTKDDTAVEGTRFELGSRPMKRNSKKDWDKVLESTKRGRFEEIPADVMLRYYSNIKRIRVDNIKNVDRPAVTTQVFWGPTGTGKTRRAREEAGSEAYWKIACTKWWDGYNGQTNVIIDEFAGEINITHMLRWLDRYPCLIEVKGSAVPLEAVNFWITSNIEPKKWYEGKATEAQINALMRRLNVTHFNDFFLRCPSPGSEPPASPVDPQVEDAINIGL